MIKLVYINRKLFTPYSGGTHLQGTDHQRKIDRVFGGGLVKPGPCQNLFHYLFDFHILFKHVHYFYQTSCLFLPGPARVGLLAGFDLNPPCRGRPTVAMQACKELRR